MSFNFNYFSLSISCLIWLEFKLDFTCKQVVIRGCRSPAAIIPGPDHGLNKFEWFSKGLKAIETFKESSTGSTQEGYLFARVCEWRLNMETGEVKERNLTGTDFPMDFPMINEHFRGVKQKYGYTQVRDCMALVVVTNHHLYNLVSLQLTMKS